MILENAQPSKQYKVMPIMISLLTAGFIGMFSETALNIALTDLMKELHITPATVQWLTTGYLLVLGISCPGIGSAFAMVYDETAVYRFTRFFHYRHADCSACAELSVSFGGKNRAGFRNRAAAAADV